MIYTDNWVVQPKLPHTKITKECLVKIDNGKERIYIDVAYIKKNGEIIGRVTNHILKEKHTSYKIEDLVMFRAKHAIEVLTLEERKHRAKELIPDLTEMCKIYIKDYAMKHNRYPTKEETELYFEQHVNIL